MKLQIVLIWMFVAGSFLGSFFVLTYSAFALTTITDCEELQDMELDLTEAYELGNDIDCSMTNPDDPDFDSGGTWADEEGFDPIGDAGLGDAFTGIFDGNNYTISDLFIETAGAAGLFDNTDAATIQDLTMEDIDFTGGYVGGITGSSVNNNIFSNITLSGGSITGTSGAAGGIVSDGGNGGGVMTMTDIAVEDLIISVNDGNNAAGIAGYMGGSITDSHVSGGSITTIGGEAGGFVGESFDITITNSYVLTDITGGTFVGGLVGYLMGGGGNTTVSNSYATGDVTATVDIAAGGLFGGIGGTGSTFTITNVYATGDVTSTGDYVGGLMGYNMGDEVSLTNVYATGNVTGDDYVAGLLISDIAQTEITNAYSSGLVTGVTNVGGLTAGVTATVISSYWDTETSGQATSTGGTGKTTAEMKQQATFAGWDFSTPIWYISDGCTYPSLSATDPCPQSNSGNSSGTHFGCTDPSATNYKPRFVKHKQELCKYETITTTSQPKTLGTPGLCLPTQIITQNLRAPSRDGVYGSYTKDIVKEVKILQAHLNRLGFQSGPEDGIIGPITDGAIKRMQTFLGTIPDGLVGPITRGLINNSCGK